MDLSVVVTVLLCWIRRIRRGLLCWIRWRRGITAWELVGYQQRGENPAVI